jgi:hypothetical protein
MDQLAPFRQYFRYAAISCSLASAVMTAWFGFQQNPYFILAGMCALFLVACSLASDYIMLFVVDAWKGKDRIMAGVVALGAVFVFSLNLMSNLGAVGWQRDVTSTAAKVANVRYEGAQDQVSESRASLAMFEKRLADLEAANGWSATVTAEALRAQLASSNLAIEQEAARGGCKAKCLARTKDRDDLAGRIAIAEERATLTGQIEATKRVIAQHRDKAATQTKVVAAPTSQALFFASMAQIDLKPSEEAQTWTDRGLAAWLALGLCIAPMLFSLLGWRSDDDTPEIGLAADEAGRFSSLGQSYPAPAQTTITAFKPAPEPKVFNTTITDRAWGEAWNAALTKMAA